MNDYQGQTCEDFTAYMDTLPKHESARIVVHREVNCKRVPPSPPLLVESSCIETLLASVIVVARRSLSNRKGYTQGWGQD